MDRQGRRGSTGTASGGPPDVAATAPDATAMRRVVALGAVAALVLALLVAAPPLATAQDEIVVTTHLDNDELDGAETPGCPTDGATVCTLRAAVAAAEDGDVITFDDGVHPRLSDGVGLGSVDIGGARSITILGNDDGGAPGTTISGGEPDVDDYNDRLFRLEGGAGVTFQSVVLTGGAPQGGGVQGGVINSLGELTFIDSLVRGNLVSGGTGVQGGAVYQSGGSLHVDGTRFEDNHAEGTNGDGGAVYLTMSEATISDSTFADNFASRYGGAVLGDGGSSTLDLDGVHFTDNRTGSAGLFSGGGAIRLERGAEARIEASSFRGNQTVLDVAGGRQGGAIFVSGSGASATIRGSHFADNAARTSGGAIFSTGGTLDIATSTFEGNSAAIGGGVSGYEGAPVTIEGSTFVGNSATDGGGVYVNGNVTLNAANSTFSGNTAEEGAGLWSAGTNNTVNLAHLTVVDNDGDGIFQEGDSRPIGAPNQPGTSTMTVTHSIIADNSGDDCGTTPLDLEGGGAIALTSDGHNLDTDGSCALDATDATVADVLLGALADNGGPTLTHLPLEGSPAIEGGLNPTCVVDVDQRGEPRPAPDSPACDIGAVEVQPVVEDEEPEPEPTPDPDPTPEPDPDAPEDDAPGDDAPEIEQIEESEPAEAVVADPDSTG
jgi:predicted outer membrane repeat protein